LASSASFRLLPDCFNYDLSLAVPLDLSNLKMPAPRAIRNRNSKFGENITKRGNVPIGKAGEHTDEPALSKGLIAFFLFVVVGSSFVQVLRMFQTSVPNFEE